MASRFQHRLVGTIILVAIGIIFLPDILDGQKIEYREETASIPLRPALAEPVAPVSFASLDEVVEAAPLAKPVQAPVKVKAETAKTNVESKPKAKPKLAPIAKPVQTAKQMQGQTKQAQKAIVGNAWHIRLGAFKNSKNVDALVTKLRKAGFNAYRLPRRPQAGKLNRLYVGPDVSRSKLVKIQPKVEKIAGLKGVIQKFDPKDK